MSLFFSSFCSFPHFFFLSFIQQAQTKVCVLGSCVHMVQRQEQGSRVLVSSSSISTASLCNFGQVTQHFLDSVLSLFNRSANPPGCLLCSKPQNCKSAWCWLWSLQQRQGQTLPELPCTHGEILSTVPKVLLEYTGQHTTLHAFQEYGRSLEK